MMELSQLPPPTAKEQAQQKAIALHRQRTQRERWAMVVTVILIVAAWLYGYFAAGVDVAPLANKVLPGAATIERAGDLFVGRSADGALAGYAGVWRGSGYGGPMDLLVGVAPDGTILGVEMVEQRESPGFFRLVHSNKLLESYATRSISAPLRLGEDLDSVSGATMSAEGVAGAVRKTPLPAESRSLQIGAPEIVLVLLFVSGYIGHKQRKPRVKRFMRWGTLLAGMVTLGFLYTLPLTISMVVSALSGYWPDWHTNLYWYLLIGGVLFVTTVEAQNPYCSWFCPFGAFQECLAAVTKVKTFRPRDLSTPLQWLQRGLALTAIVLGLALRQPAAAGYEPFATLFDLRGTPVQWALLIIVILASLMMYRPFCNYLCPLDPVVDIIAAGRRWLKEGWSAWRKKSHRPRVELPGPPVSEA
jgi:hypothetical protein